MTEKKKSSGPAPEILKIPLAFQDAVRAGLQTGTPPPDDELPKKKHPPPKPKR
ncbi:MAG: hypothetical protein QOG85_882 [Gaiellaceae bacterium]|jgi:hypothetical protein|nr:hypothetical protein [Gaiellaceae bacterium]